MLSHLKLLSPWDKIVLGLSVWTLAYLCHEECLLPPVCTASIQLGSGNSTQLRLSSGILAVRLRPFRLRDDAFAATFLELTVAFDEFPGIVPDGHGNAVSRVTHGLDGWIVLHDGSFSPSNSRGVINKGTNNPRITLTR